MNYYYILLTTFYILFTVLAWKRLNWAVLFVIAALPSYLIRFRVGPIPMTVLEGMILIIFAVWFVKRNSRIHNPSSPPLNLRGGRVGLSFYIPLLLFLLASTLSMFVSPDLRAASGIWKAYFVEPILFFFVLRDLIRNHVTRYTLHVTQIIAALSLTALALSLYAIYQRFTGFGIPPPWDTELRVTSIFPYPNALALFLAPLVPLFIAQLLTKFRHSERSEESRANARQLFVIGYWLLVTIATIVAIVFAKSTGAMVGIAAGLLLIYALWFVRSKTYDRSKLTATKFYILHTTYYILAIAGLTILLLRVMPSIKDELLLRDWSGHVRRTQWTETWQMLKDTSTPLGAGRPILGAGLAGYKETLAPYHKATYLEIFEYPHNIVLNFWSETGLLGLFAFVWLIIIFFRTTFPSLRSDASVGLRPSRASEIREGRVGYEPYTIAVMTSMVVVLIHGLVDVPYFKNDLAILFWIVYALGMELSKSTLSQPLLTTDKDVIY